MAAHTEPPGRTISHLLQVLENAKMVSEVCGQNDVSNQVQHACVVLKNIKSDFSFSRNEWMLNMRDVCNVSVSQTVYRTFLLNFSKMLQP